MRLKMLKRMISVICAVGISASCATGFVSADYKDQKTSVSSSSKKKSDDGKKQIHAGNRMYEAWKAKNDSKDKKKPVAKEAEKVAERLSKKQEADLIDRLYEKKLGGEKKTERRKQYETIKKTREDNKKGNWELSEKLKKAKAYKQDIKRKIQETRKELQSEKQKQLNKVKYSKRVLNAYKCNKKFREKAVQILKADILRQFDMKDRHLLHDLFRQIDYVIDIEMGIIKKNGMAAVRAKESLDNSICAANKKVESLGCCQDFREYVESYEKQKKILYKILDIRKDFDHICDFFKDYGADKAFSSLIALRKRMNHIAASNDNIAAPYDEKARGNYTLVSYLYHATYLGIDYNLIYLTNLTKNIVKLQRAWRDYRAGKMMNDNLNYLNIDNKKNVEYNLKIVENNLNCFENDVKNGNLLEKGNAISNETIFEDTLKYMFGIFNLKLNSKNAKKIKKLLAKYDNINEKILDQLKNRNNMMNNNEND